MMAIVTVIVAVIAAIAKVAGMAAIADEIADMAGITAYGRLTGGRGPVLAGCGHQGKEEHREGVDHAGRLLEGFIDRGASQRQEPGHTRGVIRLGRADEDPPGGRAVRLGCGGLIHRFSFAHVRWPTHALERVGPSVSAGGGQD